MVFTILQNLFEMVHSHMFNIFVKVLYCEKFIPLIFLQWTNANMSIQVQVLNETTQIYNVGKKDSVQNNVPFSQWRLIDFIEKRYCKMAWNTENSMKEYLTTFSWVFWVLLLFITMFTDWIIKRFRKLMTFTFSAKSTLFLLIKVIKDLSKVFMQQFNYPKFIWIKKNVSFACSNYRSNWQLTDNFRLHLSEPNRIETRRKRIVNRIVTTEPRCTVISVNRFTSNICVRAWTCMCVCGRRMDGTYRGWRNGWICVYVHVYDPACVRVTLCARLEW